MNKEYKNIKQCPLHGKIECHCLDNQHTFKPKEIKRIENWESGAINCLKCGKELILYFNGGELDQKECCGFRYETHHKQIDLIISEKSHE